MPPVGFEPKISAVKVQLKYAKASRNTNSKKPTSREVLGVEKECV
jgi:hypothetical protein